MTSRKKIAQEHIDTLSSLVKEIVYSNQGRANKYIMHIRKIGMKLRHKLPGTVKRSFCKHCYQAFAPGKNCRVRTRDGKLVYYCFKCKKYSRLVLKN